MSEKKKLKNTFHKDTYRCIWCGEEMTLQELVKHHEEEAPCTQASADQHADYKAEQRQLQGLADMLTQIINETWNPE